MNVQKERPIHVGIDVHICRSVETGIYTFIWNTIERLGSLREPPELTMILYGPDKVVEPASVSRMRNKFDGSRFKYYWTRIAPWIQGGQSNASAPTSAFRRWIDRNVMLRLWRKLSFGARGPLKRVVAPFQHRVPPHWWDDLDVVHHTAGLVLPMHPRANVLTINDLIPYHFKHAYKYTYDWFAESFERAKEMDGILVYSEHTKADVVQVLGIDPDRIHVVPLAAHRRFRPIEDEASIEQVVSRYGLVKQGYLLHVGTLEPRKNLTRLVEAFYELTVQEPTLAHMLVFSGPRFASFEPIFETIQNLGLQDRVLWLGAIPFDDLPALINGAATLVFPSIYEGFGLPPLEAMACGVPVIAANATSLPEVVGDAALLINPYRTSEMTAAMRSVLTDADLRARMRKAGLERASQFQWERAAELTFALYKDAVAFSEKRRRGGSVERKTEATRPVRNQQMVNEWLFDRMDEQLSRKNDPVTAAS